MVRRYEYDVMQLNPIASLVIASILRITRVLDLKIA